MTTASVLTADLAGLRNQALGLAEAAGFTPELRTIPKRRFWLSRTPHPADPAADILIGCGGASARVLAALRRPDLPAVIIQNPRMDPGRFDLVVAARHDRITGPNVLVTRTAMHRVSPARLAMARAHWAPAFAPLPRPLVAVLLGGSNGRYRLNEAIARGLAGQLARMMTRDKAGLMLTPSRRTPPAVQAIFHKTLTPLGAFVWEGQGTLPPEPPLRAMPLEPATGSLLRGASWPPSTESQQMDSKGSAFGGVPRGRAPWPSRAENPYFGILACADAIIVTADSVSMVSEAAATGAPVLLARLPGRSARIGAFMAALIAEGRVRDFTGELAYWPVQPINDTEAAAFEMRRRLGL